MITLENKSLIYDVLDENMTDPSIKQAYIAVKNNAFDIFAKCDDYITNNNIGKIELYHDFRSAIRGINVYR